jgi:hypothetical protein
MGVLTTGAKMKLGKNLSMFTVNRATGFRTSLMLLGLLCSSFADAFENCCSSHKKSFRNSVSLNRRFRRLSTPSFNFYAKGNDSKQQENHKEATPTNDAAVMSENNMTTTTESDNNLVNIRFDGGNRNSNNNSNPKTTKSLTLEELDRKEREKSRRTMQTLLLPNTIGAALNAALYAFVIIGILLEVCGYGYVLQDNGWIRVDTLEKRDFQLELRRSSRLEQQKQLQPGRPLPEDLNSVVEFP